MKAVRLHEIGGPKNLAVEDVPQCQPSEGETLVRLRAAALNHRDLFITQGLYPNIALPCILGADGAGDANGNAVVIDPTIGWGPDERVWDSRASILGVPLAGTFAQYVCVPHANVHAKPAHLSFEEAAALPLAGVTAFRALFTRGELRPGETVLITGVGGGVQTFALLYAAAIGARVLVTSSSDEKLARACALGAEIAVNYKTDPEWHKSLRKDAQGAIDLVLDSAGGETFARAVGLVRPGGRVVTYGGTAGDTKMRMFPVFWNQVDIRGSSMGSPGDFRAMLEFVSTHQIRPIVDRIYGLDGVVEAAERMQHGDQFGKVVLSVP